MEMVLNEMKSICMEFEVELQDLAEAHEDVASDFLQGLVDLV